MDFPKHVFCFTGKMLYKRSEMEAMVHQRGGKTSKTVNNSTTVLVVSDQNKILSAKMKAAKNRGVILVNESTFLGWCDPDSFINSSTTFSKPKWDEKQIKDSAEKAGKHQKKIKIPGTRKVKL